MSITQLAGLPIRNTSQIITKDTKICGLVQAAGGFGKTTFGASMDRLTKKFFGKPTLIIACDPGEGGGTMSIQDYGVDFVVPDSIENLRRLVASLHTDRVYGGVVFDPANEYVRRLVQPFALKFPSREKQQTRTAGVPERSDYQTMGEIVRQDFNQLINLTTHPDLDIRKHLLVCTLDKERKNDKGEITAIEPDLPGAMAGCATAMFQTVMAIKITTKVENAQRVKYRTLVTESDGLLRVKDRTGCFPNGCDTDLEKIYDKYWLPRIAGGAAQSQVAA